MDFFDTVVESRKTLACNFRKAYGVSLDLLSENPKLAGRLFRNKTWSVKNSLKSGIAGRGYPFMGQPRASVKEADAKSLEILSRW